MHRNLASFVTSLAIAVLLISPAYAWNNGPSGNTLTDDSSECADPPYGTHDWIADHALAILPAQEQEWLSHYKTYFLLGTEAPDNALIPEECGTPNTGYGDKGGGHHSVRWDAGFKKMTRAGAALRAQDEYVKASEAFKAKRYKESAYYLGAMSHYIADVSSFPHSSDNNTNHSKYENWVARATTKFESTRYKLSEAQILKRTPYDAVEKVSLAVAKGNREILTPVEADSFYKEDKNSDELKVSVGASLNLAMSAPVFLDTKLC
jgi:hypothetical protein